MGILRTDKISGLETPTAVTGSVEFDGTNDELVIGQSTHGQWNYLHNGRTDWTVEFWVYSRALTRSRIWCTASNSTNTGFRFDIMSQNDGQANRAGIFAMAMRGADQNYKYWGANDCLKVNTWHHIAAVFKSSDKTLAIYVDGREVDNDSGTAEGTFGAGNYSQSNSSQPLILGEEPANNGADLNGYISNLRVVAGRRLYTADFIPPTHALEVIPGTKVLCCNNPDSIFASERAEVGEGWTNIAGGNPQPSTFSPGLTRDFTSGTEFNGVTSFDTQGYFVPPSGTTTDRDRTGGRGISLGGAPSPSTARSEIIDYITISSMGNSQDFGNLTAARSLNGGCASSTRGICAGGYDAPVSTPGYLNTIDYITIAATGNAVNFGDLSVARNGLSGTSSSTRGVFAGGSKPPSDTKENVIDYLTIASLGDAINFGDLSQLKRNTGCTGSATRAIWAGGQVGPTITTVMDYVTIASTGDAADFGNLTASRRHCIGSSSGTRGIFAGGTTNPTLIDIIEYITISSTGNSQDFGNLTNARSEFGGPSNKIRAVFMGGWNSPTYDNIIDYITISSTGNSFDFGDLGGGIRGAMAGISDSHGGIS